MSIDPIRILLVDDDPALLDVLEAGLRLERDYAVTTAVRAAEALRQIESQTFDLLITDYSLDDPAVNGLVLLRASRQKTEQTLVIIITAFASLELTLEAIHLGAYDFLTKPFQLDELQLVIRNAATRVRLERENYRLREQVTQMGDALGEIERQHGELIEQFRQVDLEALPTAEPSGLAPALATINALELRRRRIREQLSSYVRRGETIREQLARERQRIETLFSTGLLPESTYQRAMMERPPAPPRLAAPAARTFVYGREERKR